MLTLFFFLIHTSTIPTEFGTLTDLLVLALDFNKLSGPIPSEFGRLTNLYILEISDNMLSGTVPEELYEMTSLVKFGVARIGNITGKCSIVEPRRIWSHMQAVLSLILKKIRCYTSL